jgi:hypothetical protein
MKLDEFHDWSRGRPLSMPPRRRPVRALAWALLGLAFLAFCWYAVHAMMDAYRIVFSS